MKKHIAWLLAAATALSLTACGGTEAASGDTAAGQETELVVFAAASLTETLNQIAEDYKTVAPDVTLTFNFDSSGTLKTQIEEGAVCDLFISAGQKQMDQLDAAADPSVNTDGLDFVLAGSRVPRASTALARWPRTWKQAISCSPWATAMCRSVNIRKKSLPTMA